MQLHKNKAGRRRRRRELSYFVSRTESDFVEMAKAHHDCRKESHRTTMIVVVDDVVVVVVVSVSVCCCSQHERERNDSE